MLDGLHHYHLRKRGIVASRDTWAVKILDRLIFVVGALGPIMTLPQLYGIWVTRQAEGVSLISWSSYFVFSMIWILYGVVHKEKPIIYTYTLWFVIEGLIIIGILLYG